MIKSFAIAACAASAILSFADVAGAQSVESEAAAETRLSCTANGVRDFSMGSQYQLRRGRKTFKAEFEAAPTVGFRVGQRLPVHVGGVAVGSVALTRDPANGDVVGSLEFDTNPLQHQPFPTNFPAVRIGTSVTVGPLGCALR